MQRKQDNKKKTNIKVNDLKPRKDAKGGARNTDTKKPTSLLDHKPTSKEKRPHHGSIPRAALVYLFVTLNKGESYK